MKSSIEQVVTAIASSWGPDTCFRADDWSEQNPARGQCVVSALVFQHYLGGDLQSFEVTGKNVHESHYANRLSATLIDVTAGQYRGMDISMRPKQIGLQGHSSVREKRLADPDTRARYDILLSRVESKLQSSRV